MPGNLRAATSWSASSNSPQQSVPMPGLSEGVASSSAVGPWTAVLWARRARRTSHPIAVPSARDHEVAAELAALDELALVTAARTTRYRSPVLPSRDEAETSRSALPSVVVVGPGAIGTYFAALLSARGLADVTLVAKNAEQAARLEASAISVVRAAPEPSEAPLVAQVRVRALAQLGALPPGAIVILTTKATALHAGLSALAPVLGPGHALVLTQNGVGVLDEAREALGASPGAAALVRAACWMGITSDAPGRARVAGVHSLVLADAGAAGLATTPEVVEGGPSASSSPAEAVRRLMAAAGLPTRLEADPRAVEWKKALWNMAVNPIGALLEAANGAVLDDQGLRRTAERILDEAMAVAGAEGVVLSASDRDLVFRSLEVTRKNYNSSLQDLWAGRPTETPWLVGAVGRLGRARGVPTPLCDALTTLLLHLERTGIRKR